MKRLFIAVNIPQDLKQKISKQFLENIPGGCKKVKEQNLHITLKFLGHLPENAIPGIVEKIRPLEREKAIEARFEGVGHFGKRVLWIGVNEGKMEIEELSKKINELLGAQEEKFSAHLTIARNRNLKPAEFEAVAQRLREEKFCERIKIESIELMESELTPDGPKYKVIEKIPLTTG